MLNERRKKNLVYSSRFEEGDPWFPLYLFFEWGRNAHFGVYLMTSSWLCNAQWSYTVSRLYVIGTSADAFIVLGLWRGTESRTAAHCCRECEQQCNWVAGRPHDNQRQERTLHFMKIGVELSPPSFHPLTHCGTISVSKMYRTAPRHLSHSVPSVLCTLKSRERKHQRSMLDLINILEANSDLHTQFTFF